jgi:hypothetical protein
MLETIVMVVGAFVIGLILGVVLAPKVRTGEAAVLHELHQLIDAGHIKEEHVADYVDALIGKSKAEAAALDAVAIRTVTGVTADVGKV